MNVEQEDKQKQLRIEIKSIHADTSLSQFDKQRKIHTLMNNYNLNKINCSKSVIKEDCKHYQRGCQIECPDNNCKGELFNCRLCHDKVITDHSLDRFKINTVKCNECETIQPIQQSCKNLECNTIFGNYYCDVCHLFENNTEKEIYHCVDCGICRVGNKDKYQHCTKCNHCINIETYETHKCFDSTWGECPICMDSLKDSTLSLYLLECGHGAHLECIKTLLQSDYRCPLCKKSIGDMSNTWDRMRNNIDNLRGNVISVIGNNQPQLNGINILNRDGSVKNRENICNDCGNNFITPQNVFNMYPCDKCSSFNTS